jgi:hypothetical protein
VIIPNPLMRFLRTALLGVSVTAQIAGAQSILRLPVSTRALGLVNVAVAGRDDDVLFYNPAQLAVARGTTLSGERDSGALATGALSSATAFASGGVGVGAVFSRVELRLPTLPTGVSTLIPSSELVDAPVTSIVGMAAVAQVVKGVRVGVAGKYMGEHLYSQYESRTMADVGLARDFARYFTAGLAVQNIGIIGRSLLGSAPVRATLGAAGSGPVGPYDVVLTTAVRMDDHDHHVRPAAGGEVGWSWLSGYTVALRAGVRDPVAGERAFTAGAGLVVDRISLDYALETLAGSRVGHRIGLRVR